MCNCIFADGDWLFGSTCTAADITAAILLWRLNMIGVLPRFASAQKNPEVAEYWKRLLSKDSVRKTFSMIEKVPSVYFKSALKKYAKIAFKVGLVAGFVGVGYLGVKQYARINTGLKKA